MYYFAVHPPSTRIDVAVIIDDAEEAKKQTLVATPMVLNFFKNKKFKKLALGNIPMGKLATESDIATTVCFLASSASSMITGTSIVIDGGWTAQ